MKFWVKYTPWRRNFPIKIILLHILTRYLIHQLLIYLFSVNPQLNHLNKLTLKEGCNKEWVHNYLGRRVNIESVTVEMVFIFYGVSFLSLYSFLPGPQKATLKEDVLQKAKFFQHKKYLSRIARGSRDDTVQNFTRNTSHTFKSGKGVIKTAPKQHDKGARRV